MYKNVTCKNCGWVHFEVTRDYAENQVTQFNQYFDTLSKEKQQDYYGGRKSSIISYEQCMLCRGNYKEFKESKSGDCPVGCTLNPIIRRQD